MAMYVCTLIFLLLNREQHVSLALLYSCSAVLYYNYSPIYCCIQWCFIVCVVCLFLSTIITPAGPNHPSPVLLFQCRLQEKWVESRSHDTGGRLQALPGGHGWLPLPHKHCSSGPRQQLWVVHNALFLPLGQHHIQLPLRFQCYIHRHLASAYWHRMSGHHILSDNIVLL